MLAEYRQCLKSSHPHCLIRTISPVDFCDGVMSCWKTRTIYQIPKSSQFYRCFPVAVFSDQCSRVL